MSKVGNLRAMFENKGDTSPPERGRSPGLSSTGAESPRPLSKIRTNFVAIEKDGRIGLQQRDPSSDSILSVTRKPPGDGEAEASTPTAQEGTPSFTDRIKSSRQGSQMETIPQSPPQDMPSTFQNITPVAPAPAPAKNGDSEGKSVDKTPAAESKDVKDAPRAGSAKAAVRVPEKDQPEGVNAKSAVEKDKAKPAAKEATKATSSSKPAASKPAAINTSKTTMKAAGKSPNPLKTPTSPLKGARLPTKTPERKALHPEKSATPKSKPAGSNTKTGGAAEAGASAKKPPVLQASPAGSLDRGIGFVKPKVKSPTRPVTLPPGLTSHTAASATRQSLSRQSGVFLSAQPAQGRSPSRTSVSTNGGSIGGSGRRPLRRQSSTINRPRPSLGPPPKQVAVDHPITRREREVDEGFLARMMRPTQASSYKTHEKVVSPPRKAPGALPAAKRPIAKDTVGATTKAAPKPEIMSPRKAPAKADIMSPKKAPAKAETTSPKKVVPKAIEKKKQKTASSAESKVATRKAQPAPKTPEPGKPKAEAAEKKSAKSPVEAEAKASESAVETPAEEPSKQSAEEAHSAQDNAAEAKVESADVAPASEESPAAEETASEAEPVEPKTPVEAAGVAEDKSAAGLVTDGAEAKLAQEEKAVLEVDKQTDDAPLAE